MDKSVTIKWFYNACPLITRVEYSTHITVVYFILLV